MVSHFDRYGQSLQFGYNGDLELKTITDATGKVTQLVYNSNGKVERVEDPFGRIARFEYDSNDNLVKITDMGEYWTEIDYDEDVYLSRLENSRGAWLFKFEPADQISNGSSHYPPPDADMWEDYRITVADPMGGMYEYYYDGYSGYSWSVSPNDYVKWESDKINNYALQVPKTKYFFTSGNVGDERKIKQISYPEGTQTNYTYYSDTGEDESITDTKGNTTYYQHNESGRVTSITDPLGNITNYTYDSNGVDVKEIKSPLGAIRMTYNSTHDVLTLTDARDRMATTGDTPTGLVDRVTTFSYNSYGQLLETTSPLNVISAYDYNADHQLESVRKDNKQLRAYTYDHMGRIQTAIDSNGVELTYEYNELNHITRIIYPDHKYTEYVYSDCCPRIVDHITDRAGQSTFFIYDELKRLIKVINPAQKILRYKYDLNGNLIELIDQQGKSTHFEYDKRNRLIAKQYADGHKLKYTYNSIGLIEKHTNARQVDRIYSYNALNQITNINYSDDTPDITYAYDGYGRLESISDAVGTHNFSYYANSLIKSVDGPWESDTLSYTYDKLSRIESVTPESGQALTQIYDTLGRLANVKTGNDSFVYHYKGAGNLVESLERPNGAKTVYSYNAPINRLKTISNQTSTSEIINQVTFEYNEKDLIESETQEGSLDLSSLSDKVTRYYYNEVNQLTSSDNPTKTFEYDSDGNMIKGYTQQGYEFSATYDAENRLKSLQYIDDNDISHKLEFLYNHSGLLSQLKTYEANLLTKDMRIIRNGFLAMQERDANNRVTREYAWGLDMGGGIGGLLQLRQNEQNYYHLYDGKGNVSAIIDGNQAVVAKYRYDGFGNRTAQSGSFDQPFMFSTKRHIAQTGLIYYGYRYYQPAVGRWLTRDPLQEAGGLNLYEFVQNNPVNYIDPWGLKDRKPRRRPKYGFPNGILGLGVSMQASHNSPSPPVSPEEWKAIQNLLDNISNFFPGPKIMVPPQEIFNKGCPQDYNG
jgi:RHS repeat-associated protein